MINFEEKKVIYHLMKEIVEERRSLTKQYYELKERLDCIYKNDSQMNEQKKSSKVIVNQGKKGFEYDYHRKKVKTLIVPVDRVSKNIISILKQSTVLMSNKNLLNKLNTEYDLSISLSNLSSNILPKMINERSLPIQKAYRGYWQYKRLDIEGRKNND